MDKDANRSISPKRRIVKLSITSVPGILLIVDEDKERKSVQ